MFKRILWRIYLRLPRRVKKAIIQLSFSREEKSALRGKFPMTQDILFSCLDRYYLGDDLDSFFALWDRYPGMVEERLDSYEASEAGQRHLAQAKAILHPDQSP